VVNYQNPRRIEQAPMSDSSDGNNDQNQPMDQFLGGIFNHIAGQQAMAHVRWSASTKVRSAITVEATHEYDLIRARALEFDWALDVPETSPDRTVVTTEGSTARLQATLEMASAGYARHRLAAKQAEWLSRSAKGQERAEYRAKMLEHQAMRVRWSVKLSQIVDLENRLRAAAETVSKGNQN
jgi:hypothetical protein